MDRLKWPTVYKEYKKSQTLNIKKKLFWKKILQNNFVPRLSATGLFRNPIEKYQTARKRFSNSVSKNVKQRIRVCGQFDFTDWTGTL